MNIFVFQTGGIGDVVIASGMGAEGLKKKYPDCHLTWATDTGAGAFLQNNPFIDVVKVWSASHSHRLYPEATADLKIFLYGWLQNESTIYRGFHEDLGVADLVPQKTKIYLTDAEREKGKLLMAPYLAKGKPVVTVHDDMSFRGWGGKGQKEDHLIRLLEREPVTVLKVGCATGVSYTVMAAMLQHSDLHIGREGSMAHVACAVGTSTVTLRTIHDPKLTMCAITQKEWANGARHDIVHPRKWCNDYWLCMTADRHVAQVGLPHGTTSKRFGPKKYADCPEYKTNCIESIAPEEVAEAAINNLKARGEL